VGRRQFGFPCAHLASEGGWRLPGVEEFPLSTVPRAGAERLRRRHSRVRRVVVFAPLFGSRLVVHCGGGFAAGDGVGEAGAVRASSWLGVFDAIQVLRQRRRPVRLGGELCIREPVPRVAGEMEGVA